MIQKIYQIEINAPAKKVRHTMLDDKTYRIWTLVFNPAGSWFEWDWSEDSQITFLGPNPENLKEIWWLFAIVEENKLYQYISLAYQGEIENGDLVPWNRDWMYEKYIFTETNWITKLEIKLDTEKEWSDFMDSHRPLGLQKIKELAEK